MSLNARSIGTIDREPEEGFSVWWWLVAPILVVVLISLLGNLAPEFYETWIGTEVGLLEDSRVVITLVGAFLALRLFLDPEVRDRPPLLGCIGFALAGCVYIAGGEASWGQNYAGWAMPEFWQGNAVAYGFE